MKLDGIMRFSRATAKTTTFVALIAAVAATARGQGAAKPLFSTGATLANDRFGLFIGINRYPVLKTHDLDGCVNDAMNYKRIFVDAGRYNVQRYALLTDQQATREGITQALLELIEQVKAARTTLGPGKPITVVITYAGHGMQVPRKDKNSPLGPMDSSWVASDSDLSGTRNIRGEELFAVHSALRQLGADVIMISDSCHSGTAYRGFDKVRGLEVARDATGPADTLFDGLLKGVELPRDLASYNNPAGFVWYAACADSQQAFETTDEKGSHCGRLSLVMRKVLLNAADTSYQGLARQVAQEFSLRWPANGGQQTPEFHAASGKENGLFFSDKVAPFHASILSVNDRAKTAEISLGQIEGISEGTTFKMYAGLNDAVVGQKIVATGTVTRADATTSTVRYDGTLTLSAWCLPEVVDMHDFSVALDDASTAPVPPWLTAKLAELDKGQQIRIVKTTDSPSVVIHSAPQGEVDFYSPSALPSAGAGTARPEPLRALLPPAKAQDYPEMFAENLLYLARLQRFATLEHGWTAPLTNAAAAGRLAPFSADIVASKAPAEATPAIQQLHAGDTFTLRITNNTTRELYPTVFTIGKGGKIDILYPQPGDDIVPVTADHPLSIGADQPFRVRLNDAKAASERTQMKIIVTEKPQDFSQLTLPPQTGAANVRDARSGSDNDALFGLLRDALHGGPRTRDVERDPPKSKWGTLNVVFDAVAK